ncbi:MAG: hypothetical protein KGJ41_14590 [Rhodospirillales bacterium]|nr:hypothetical protein [Rhodospirillales bacterium]MDE2200242.1 hypothetical protein [Rhodospirillales bacterium]MDE2574959.1 hypothetical protein [Rhodospirillales bacterium]
MSDHKNAEFLKDPEKFLKNNLLIVRIQALEFGAVTREMGEGYTAYRGANKPKHTDGKVLTVNIQKTQTCFAKNAAGSGIDACEVVEASGVASKHSHRFSAYYLPFFNNQTKTMVLQPPLNATTTPGFYFTDEMTGCAFAAGAGPLPRVGHFNFTTTGTDDGNIDDGKVNREIGQALGVPQKALRKADYKRDAADHVTLLGVSGANGWTFWWQRFTVTGMKDGKYIYQIGASPTRI